MVPHLNPERCRSICRAINQGINYEPWEISKLQPGIKYLNPESGTTLHVTPANPTVSPKRPYKLDITRPSRHTRGVLHVALSFEEPGPRASETSPAPRRRLRREDSLRGIRGLKGD